MRLRIVAVVLMTSRFAYGFAWSTASGTNNPIANDTALENVCAGAVGEDHGLLVAWTEGTSPTRDVFADRIDPEGRRMWISGTDQGIEISVPSADDAYEAAICGDGALGAYIVWTNEPAAGQRDIFAVRVGPTGVPYPDWAPYVNVTAAIGNDCFHPTVCYVAGQAYIAYKNDVYAGSELPSLDVACYNPAAELQWTAQVGPAGVSAGGAPIEIRLWPDGDGGIYVVWERGPAGNEDVSTFAIRLDAYGYGVWGGDPIELFRILGNMSSSERAVCPDGAGGLFVAGPYRIFAPTPNLMQEPYGELMIVNHLDGAGNWQWGVWDWGTYVDVFIVSEWVGVTQSNPAIAPVEGGGCVVAWVDDRWPYSGINNPYRGTDGLSIYAQHIDGLGIRKWDEQAEYDELLDDYVLPSLFRHRNYLFEGAPFTGGATATKNFGRLHAAPSPEGTPCFVWADDRDVDDELHIYAEEPRLSDGSPRWPGSNLEVSTRVLPLGAPYVYVPDPRWGGYVVWTDSVEVNAPDVYAAHINYYFDLHWFRVSNGLAGGPDIFPPPPVRDFHGEGRPDGVWLTWTNPSRYCGGEYLGTSDGSGSEQFTTARRSVTAASYTLYAVDGTAGTDFTLLRRVLQGSQELYVREDISTLGAGDWIMLDNGVDREYFLVEDTDVQDRIVHTQSRVWTPSGFGIGSTLREPAAAPAAIGGGDYSIDLPTGIIDFTSAAYNGLDIIIEYETDVTMLDNFWGVMIRRGTSSPPYTAEEGEWVFGGPGMPGAGASECLDTGAVVGETYYYSAFSYDTVPADTNFAAATPCLENPIEYGMDEVRDLTAIPDDSGEIRLTWQNPPQCDLVEVWTPEKATGTRIYQGTGETYTDGGLNNGQEYTYTVYVIVALAYTNGVEVKAVPLAPVTFLVVTATESSNSLTWTNPSPATWLDGVRIQRDTVGYPAGPDKGENVYEYLGEAFEDTDVVSGTTYFYTVFAYYEPAARYYSAGVEDDGMPGDWRAPGDVIGLTATPGNGMVTLRWTNPPDGDFVGVLIFRSEQGSAVEQQLSPNPVNTEFHVDTGLTNDVTYVYTVKTYDDKVPVNVSTGEQDTAMPRVTPLFLQSPSVTINDSYSVTIDWETNVEVTGWAEYGTTPALGQRSANVDSADVGPPYGSSLDLVGLHAGATYYCTIRIADSDGHPNSVVLSTFPMQAPPSGDDVDGDEIPDDWELQYFDTIADCDPAGDDDLPQADGLTNLEEYRHGTNPLNPDTDGDLMDDGDEVAVGNNPVAPDAPLPMRRDAGGCGSAAALVAVLALLSRRKRRTQGTTS